MVKWATGNDVKCGNYNCSRAAEFVNDTEYAFINQRKAADWEVARTARCGLHAGADKRRKYSPATIVPLADREAVTVTYFKVKANDEAALVKRRTEEEERNHQSHIALSPLEWAEAERDYIVQYRERDYDGRRQFVVRVAGSESSEYDGIAYTITLDNGSKYDDALMPWTFSLSRNGYGSGSARAARCLAHALSLAADMVGDLNYEQKVKMAGVKSTPAPAIHIPWPNPEAER